jgi:hypothetical protein
MGKHQHNEIRSMHSIAYRQKYMEYGVIYFTADHILYLFVCCLDCALDSLPVRNRDGAYILNEAVHTFKRLMVEGPIIYLQR